MPDIITYFNSLHFFMFRGKHIQVMVANYYSININDFGLVPSCHNNLRGGVLELDIKYLNTTHIRDESLILPGIAVRSGKSPPSVTRPLNNPPVTASDSEQKVYLLIYYLW